MYEQIIKNFIRLRVALVTRRLKRSDLISTLTRIWISFVMDDHNVLVPGIIDQMSGKFEFLNII